MSAASTSLVPLRRAGWLAVLAAALVFGLRLGAWLLTGSLAVLADVIEPLFNLLAATVTLVGVIASRRPADPEHPFGHRKLEFLAVGFHGAMALGGAGVVVYAAIWQWWTPFQVRATPTAVVLFLVSMALSAGLARTLIQSGAEHNSPALRAAGRHAWVDVWVGLGVLLNLLLVGATGWQWLDVAVSLVLVGVAVYGAWRLARRSVLGLMDTAEPGVRGTVDRVVALRIGDELVGYHDIRCRDSGGKHYVDLHLQFADGTSLERAHEIGEEVEVVVEAALGSGEATVHIEPASEIRGERSADAIPPSPRERSRRRAAMVSLAVAVLLVATQFTAYFLTHSSAVLSDAMESVVNIAAAAFAIYSVRLSRSAADRRHPYGHYKIEFLAAAFEGALIFLAGLLIIAAAVPRLLRGAPTERLDFGLALVCGAAACNGLLGWYLIRIGRHLHSLTLEADGKHVVSDVWTSLGVVVGLLVVRVTGWSPADPLAAIVLALLIIVAGARLVVRSAYGVMDSVSPETVQQGERVLSAAVEAERILGWHKLRVRDVGAFRFVDVHIQLPEGASLAAGHDVAEELERELEDELAPAGAIIHAEPASDVG
ncbi:MAG: cation transporter [Armatimonadetes bacterium]|nr:cation transporter [Armatimonadota bacterium]